MQECRYEYFSSKGKTWTPWYTTAFTGINAVINKLKVEYRNV